MQIITLETSKSADDNFSQYSINKYTYQVHDDIAPAAAAAQEPQGGPQPHLDLQRRHLRTRRRHDQVGRRNGCHFHVSVGWLCYRRHDKVGSHDKDVRHDNGVLHYQVFRST